MTVVDQWKHVLSNAGLLHTFSPSGHAVAFQPMREPVMQVIEVCFANGQEPLVFEYDEPIAPPLFWVSDTELVYQVPGQQLDSAPKIWLWVLSVETGTSRPLIEMNDSMSVQWAGTSGHLSLLIKPENQAGLFDLNVQTGILQRLIAFDTALDRLDVYPGFGHAFCPARQEVIIGAWRVTDYLPFGIELATADGTWLPDLDVSSILERPDGRRLSVYQRMQEVRQQTSSRLFLLDTTGSCQEVPETQRSHDPIWSPDSSLFSFHRWEYLSGYKSSSVYGIGVAKRENLSLMRLGGCGRMNTSPMHPAGVLLCNLEKETLASTDETKIGESRWNHWKGFVLRNGEVKPE